MQLLQTLLASAQRNVTRNRRWTMLRKIEHKFFYELSTGRIAIADDSGSTPETTDHGILFIDPRRPVAIGKYCSYGLLNEDNADAGSTVCSEEEAAFVSELLELPAKIGHLDGLYRLTPA